MNFWHGRYVIVTGAKGFLGTHLCERLARKGAYVAEHSSQIGDLRVHKDAHELYDMAPPDKELRPVLFHLAARVSGIGAIAKSPASSLYDNLLMGLNVLQAAVDTHYHGTIVLAGSVCAYPKFTPQPMVEANLWEGYPEETNGPYGIAKRTLTVAAEAYRKQYGLNVLCPMLANLFGPGDDFDPETSHVIPALMRKMIEAREANDPEVVVWGTGNASRDFLYVQDAVDALLLVAENIEHSAPINIGTGMETPISGLAATLQTVTNYKGKLVYDTSKPDGQPRRCLKTHQAKQVLGWQARTGLEEGLQNTYDWHEPMILQEINRRNRKEAEMIDEMKRYGFKV